jgi:hypothetical protein
MLHKLMDYGSRLPAMALLWASVAGAVCHFASDHFVSAYNDDVCRNVSTAFLGTAGFIFTVYTFIVVKVREGVLASAGYKNHWLGERSKAEKVGRTFERYGAGLGRLSDRLSTTVLVCVVVAVLNFCLAFSLGPLTVAISCSASVVGVWAVVCALFWARHNFAIWIHYAAEDELASPHVSSASPPA